MKTDLVLTASTTFDAAISKVWDALTIPELVKKYFFGTELKSDFKVGSPITFSGVWEGKPYEDKGTILEIEKGKRLKYNYWSNFSGEDDEPANYANITYELQEMNGQTMLTVTQDNCKNQEALEHSKKNWQAFFVGMKELLESKS